MVKFLMFILTVLFITGLPFLSNSIEVSLWVNAHHSVVLDIVFSTITNIGHSVFYIIISLFLYWRTKHLRLQIYSFVTLSIFVQGLKRIIFPDHFRPTVVLAQMYPDMIINTIGNVVLDKYSFPSGHAASIFAAVIIYIVLMNVKDIWKIMGLVLIAIAVSFSRVYLLYHFYCDIYWGAVIGSLSTFCCLKFLKNCKLITA